MKKILVIEDEQPIRETLIELLEAEGFKAIGAENGSTGIQLARENLPDLILCDVMMPDQDGYSVLTTVRQDPAILTTPFIFLTARDSKADLRQGMALGADDYLSKPCSVDELLAAIASRLEKQAGVVQQSDRKLDDLRKNIALSLPHELYTPLNAIFGLSEILLDQYNSDLPGEVLEAIGDIHVSAERLQRIIQNYLLYAELELIATDLEQSQALRSEQVSHVNQWIIEAAVKVAERVNRQTDLQLDLQEASIQISGLKLRKIIEELVDNACKFSSHHTPIRLVGMVSNGLYILEVIDQGRGMSAEHIKNLGAYMQFERSLYEQQGSGLGLTIVKRLAEIHLGQFIVDSVPGQQTTVRVALPLAENVES